MITICNIAETLENSGSSEAYQLALQFKEDLKDKNIPEPEQLDTDGWYTLSDMLIDLLERVVNYEEETELDCYKQDHLTSGHYDKWDSALPPDRRLYR